MLKIIIKINTLSRSIFHLALLIAIGCFIILTQTPLESLANEEANDLFTMTKKEFVEKFEIFKKEGLTAEQVKELTDKLIDAAGDKIEGTGTETLLKTMNKQAENTLWIMEKKETAEGLIDFVGDVYAMASSDTPPDPVEAYKALGKGVALGAKLAEKMPVMKVAAVPMLNAYAQAIKNGEKHIEAIAAATRAKNRAIALGWRSMDYEDALAATEMDEIEDDTPTEEELQLEKDRIKRQEVYGEYLNFCSDEYNAYDKASTARHNTWKQLKDQKGSLDNNMRTARNRLSGYNDAVRRYKDFRTRYHNAVLRRDNERSKMQRAKAEGNEAGYLARKSMLEEFEGKLPQWKKNLLKEYDKLSNMRSKYMEARTRTAHTRDKYNSLLAMYNKKDNDFKNTKVAFDACIKRCETGQCKKPDNRNADTKMKEETSDNYQKIEMISVPSSGTVVKSKTVLQKGQLYTVVVKGTIGIGGPGDGLGDAEYADFSNPPKSVFDVCGRTGGTDFGIGIDDSVNDGAKEPRWGAYNPDHIYKTRITGKGQPANLNFHDCNYGDNSGSLTVEIWGNEPPKGAWIGKWKMKAMYTETKRVWDWWFVISKKGNDYTIQTHTQSPAKIISITDRTLEFDFNDELRTNIKLRLIGPNSAEGEVNQPNNKGLPHGRVAGTRSADN